MTSQNRISLLAIIGTVLFAAGSEVIPQIAQTHLA